MFARNVAVRLKPNSMGEFTRVFENDVLSILQKQTGFQDEITFSTSRVESKWSRLVCGTRRNTREYTTARVMPKCLRF